MPARPAIPRGERIYAIGDIHGRLDLLDDLLQRIREDGAAREPKRTTVIQLGNLIDIGPSSAALIQQFMNFTAVSPNIVVLKGNHEEIMAEALEGNECVMSVWLEMGGYANLESWGLDAKVLQRQRLPELATAARQAVPTDVARWLKGLPLYFRSGDYVFVHAGLRPGIPIEEQDTDDLLWIETDFTDSEIDHGFMIVHGHSPCPDGPTIKANRIGMDTAAHQTGRLSALGVEGADFWTLTTG